MSSAPLLRPIDVRFRVPEDTQVLVRVQREPEAYVALTALGPSNLRADPSGLQSATFHFARVDGHRVCFWRRIGDHGVFAIP